ncbi:MAG: hypothetical protein ACRDOK_29505 [Streptosporangiaceae bacterium]
MSADEQPPSGAGQTRAGAAGATYRGLGGLADLGGPRRRNSLTLIRIVVAVLAVILLFGSVTHIVPAVRAGLREGTRGYWVVTGQTCSRKACTWTGKFVLPGGHVQLASAQYDGPLPVGIHAGTRIPALDPGGGLLFPTTGSDLWISLLIAIVVALIGLYWVTHRWVANYFRQRADTTGLAAPLR